MATTTGAEFLTNLLANVGTVLPVDESALGDTIEMAPPTPEDREIVHMRGFVGHADEIHVGGTVYLGRRWAIVTKVNRTTIRVAGIDDLIHLSRVSFFRPAA